MDLKKVGDTKTKESFRINVIAGRFGLGRDIPCIDYAGADNEADVMASAQMLKKKGFDVRVVKVTEIFERVV